jgi:hypothetical protein
MRLRIAMMTWPVLLARQRVAMTLWVLGFNDLAERVMRRKEVSDLACCLRGSWGLGARMGPK